MSINDLGLLQPRSTAGPASQYIILRLVCDSYRSVQACSLHGPADGSEQRT